jgi:hypothetical protein
MTRHPAATGALLLGIASILVPVLGPFAWMHGRRVVREVDASRLDGLAAAVAGRNLGLVGTLFLVAVLGLGLFAGVPSGPNGV